MTWDAGRLVGASAPSGLALAIDVEAFELVGPAAQFALDGATLAAALTWADRQQADAAGAAPRAIKQRSYDMPAHAVQTGGAFARDSAALAELGAWYGA